MRQDLEPLCAFLHWQTAKTWMKQVTRKKVHATNTNIQLSLEKLQAQNMEET